jgi:hypothetical protein
MKTKTKRIIFTFLIISILTFLVYILYPRLSIEYRWILHKTKFSGEPSLLLSLNKPEYKVNEPINAQVVLLNEGEGDLLIASSIDYHFLHYAPIHFDFFLFNEKNTELDPLIPKFYIDYGDPVFVNIGPHESVPCNTCKLSILDLYPNYLQIPGTYYLQAIYWNHLNPNDGRVAWKGELKSNIVKFEIK